MSNDYPKPILVPAPVQPAMAAFIFLHGLGDDGESFIDLARQFHQANKLPYMDWVLPTARENRDAMTVAWYTPTSLSPLLPQRPELEEEEDEDGLLEAVRYVETLIDDLVAKGIPASRIVLGGFSQGHAVSTLTSMVSIRYSGNLAGIVALSGYLPLGVSQIRAIRKERGLPEELSDATGMPVFIARGSRDVLVPKRFFRMNIEGIEALGIPKGLIEAHEYDGLGHSINGAELHDLNAWLEKVVPLKTAPNVDGREYDVWAS